MSGMQAHGVCDVLDGPGELLLGVHGNSSTAALPRTSGQPAKCMSDAQCAACRRIGFATCWTGLVSYFWACTALPALLILVGPEGTAGSWAHCALRWASKFRDACPTLFRVRVFTDVVFRHASP